MEGRVAPRVGVGLGIGLWWASASKDSLEIHHTEVREPSVGNEGLEDGAVGVLASHDEGHVTILIEGRGLDKATEVGEP